MRQVQLKIFWANNVMQEKAHLRFIAINVNYSLINAKLYLDKLRIILTKNIQIGNQMITNVFPPWW